MKHNKIIHSAWSKAGGRAFVGWRRRLAHGSAAAWSWNETCEEGWLVYSIPIINNHTGKCLQIYTYQVLKHDTHFDSCTTRALRYVKFSVAWSLSACWFCWNICWSIEGAAWWAISQMSQFGNVAAVTVLEEVLCDWKLKLHHAVQIRFGHCVHCQFGELFTCLPVVYRKYGYEAQTASSPPVSI